MQKIPGPDMSFKHAVKQVTSQSVCVCVCQLLFHLQAQGLLGLAATFLRSSPTAMQLLSLGVTTHRFTSQLLLCLCAGS